MARPAGTTRAKKPITKYEYDKLIEFVSKTNYIKQKRARVKLKRAFTLLYLTGCRISEIVNFTTQDLRAMVEKQEFSLANNTKTKHSRLIVFSDAQLDLLKNLLPQADAVIKDFSLFDVNVAYLTIKANDVIHKCLGELYSTHSFRAGYVTRLAQIENIKLVQEDIGHTNVATTARYIKVTDEQKRIAKSKINW